MASDRDGRRGDQRLGQRLPFGQRGHVVGVPDLRGHDGGDRVRGDADLLVPLGVPAAVADQGQRAQALAADRHRVDQQRAGRLPAHRHRTGALAAVSPLGQGQRADPGQQRLIDAPRAGASPAPRRVLRDRPRPRPRRTAGRPARPAGRTRSPAVPAPAGSAPSAVSSRSICATAKSSTAAADPPWRARFGHQIRADLARGAPLNPCLLRLRSPMPPSARPRGLRPLTMHHPT